MPGPWPGFSSSDQDNLDSIGNGKTVNPAGYQTVTLRDANGDGWIRDTDTDDSYSTTSDKVIGSSFGAKTVKEVALYSGSSFVADGVAYTGDITVLLFTDGTWAARLVDTSMPANTFPHEVTSVRLGQFSGTEYDGVYQSTINKPLCFAAEAPIRVPGGWVAAGALRPGDAVETAQGRAPVLWCHSKAVAGQADDAPVLIPAGTLGATRPLRLSPLHRVLIRAPQAELLFGRPEALVRAIDLVGRDGISQAPTAQVRYVHLLLPRHAILQAAGVACESYAAGDWSQGALAPCDQRRLAAALAVAGLCLRSYGPTAAPCLKPAEARLLLAALPARLSRQCTVTGAKSFWRASTKAVARSRTSASRSPSALCTA